MTGTSDVIHVNQWLWRIPGSDKYHKYNGCGIPELRERDIEPSQATASLIDSIERGVTPGSLCRRCFGTNGRKPVSITTKEPSLKVTIDGTPGQTDTSTAITPPNPRKDHGMAGKISPPVTDEGEQASVAAINAAESERTEATQELAASPKATLAPPGTVSDPGFDWNSLSAAIPAPTPQPGASRKIDAIAETPASIRARAESSLKINTGRVLRHANSTASRARVNYHWDIQQVPSEQIGDEFKVKLERYARHRPANTAIEFREEGTPDGQVTARCGKPTWYRTGTNGKAELAPKGSDGAWLGVRYSVRPFEQRQDSKRLPGS